MCYLFESFKGWKEYCESQNVSLVDSVIEYEVEQKNSSEEKNPEWPSACLFCDERCREIRPGRGNDFSLWDDQ